MAVEPTLPDDGEDPHATVPDVTGAAAFSQTPSHPGGSPDGATSAPTSPFPPSDDDLTSDDIPPTMAGPTAIGSLSRTDLAPPTAELPTDEVTPMSRGRLSAGDRPTPEPRSNAYWDTIESSGEFQPGQLIFNRYLVEKKLGGGGMGDVWLVKHRDLNTHRALKVIVSRISYDHQARARFKREAHVMASFHHPNAVVVHDARLTDQDVAYIEMEYVRGDALSDVILKGQPMPLEWIDRVLDQLCDALGEAHAAGIIHRDLKPANLMLVADREPGREMLKVLDFGIAKILTEPESTESAADEAGPKTMTGAFLGTPFYASPEQAEGVADIDQRSDIYAVGVILYEFLTGFRPFTGSAQRVLVQVLTQPPPPFAEANPAVEYPPQIEALVMRCLAKSPAERPQTARELASLFHDAIPKPEGPPVKPVDSPPHRTLLPLITTVAVVSLLIVSVLAFVMNQGETRIRHKLPNGFVAAPQAPLDELGRPLALTGTGEIAPLQLRMIVLPGRKFVMGLLSDDYEVTVEPFAISDTEVTNGQMHTYYKAKGITPPKKFEDAFAKLPKEEADKHPAVFVPREDAEGFAHWIGGALPTSEQWEYAARSCGLADRYYVWKTPFQPGKIEPIQKLKAVSGNTNLDNPDGREMPTAPVRNYGQDKTDQDVFDMMGNVREWCRADPKVPSGPHPVRGGSWNTPADLYSNFDGSKTLDGKEMLHDLGFRVVVELPADK